MGTPVQSPEPLALPTLQSRVQFFPKALEVQVPKPPLQALGRGTSGAVLLLLGFCSEIKANII